MDPTLIAFAMPQEAEAFLQLARRLDLDLPPAALPLQAPAARRYRGESLEVWVTGIGMANAGRVGQAALESVRPARLVTCGVAGALDPGASVGRVYHDHDDGFPGAERLRAAGSLPGRMVTRDQVVVTRAEKAGLHAETGAHLVDMESEVLRDLARSAGIPSATVRSVSDTAHHDLPLDFNRVYGPEKSLLAGRLALEIAKAPWKIPALVRFGRDARVASVRLAEVLGAAFTSPAA